MIKTLTRLVLIFLIAVILSGQIERFVFIIPCVLVAFWGALIHNHDKVKKARLDALIEQQRREKEKLLANREAYNRMISTPRHF